MPAGLLAASRRTDFRMAPRGEAGSEAAQAPRNMYMRKHWLAGGPGVDTMVPSPLDISFDMGLGPGIVR